jgi:hypothetical protein
MDVGSIKVMLGTRKCSSGNISLCEEREREEMNGKHEGILMDIILPFHFGKEVLWINDLCKKME